MAKKDVTLEELKAEYAKHVAEIRKILNGRKDKNDLSDTERNTLRREYLQAADCANRISKRVTDDKEGEQYHDIYTKLSAAATKYGSVVRGEIPKTTLDDIKGQEEVKKLVRSFIFMMKNSQILKYYKMEGGLGLLMYGAPGTGKTMFAEAIANAMQLPMFVVTPADIFKSYVGASEAAVKQIFEELDACGDGAVLFVDECESIFSKRTSETKDYKSAVTTELLQRMNGFGVDGSNRVLIGATNRPDLIDPAYLRYKRFSHQIHIKPPDRPALKAIIESKLDGIALDGITVEDILNMADRPTTIQSPQGLTVIHNKYSAADICGILEEACRLAMERIQALEETNPIPLTLSMFEQAFSKVPPSITEEMLREYDNFRR